MLNQLTAAMIHFQTPDLLTGAVESFRSFYPEVHLLIFDNGSKDGSRSVVESLAARHPDVTRTVCSGKNIFHGPAMDWVMRNTESPLVFFLDTDVQVINGGFLEAMAGAFADLTVYGAGRLNTVNKRGFTSASGTRIVLTPYMMIRRNYYLKLPPFEHHGMPTLVNFTVAAEKGYRFEGFPIDDYIRHFGRGTAGKYGYQLGVKGRWSFLMNKLGM